MEATTGQRPSPKIGVQLPEVEREVRWSEQIAIAVAAEEVGFDSVWVGDHLLYDAKETGRRGPWEAWTQLAAIAQATERVEIGPLVAATPFHEPAMLAKMAVTVDEISGGRLILGLGAGWNRTEFAAFGFPFDHRASRFEEAFHLIRRLVAGERVTHHGEYYEVVDSEIIPKGPRPEGPPLMIGSIGSRMLDITLPHVDQWNVWWKWFDNDPTKLAGIISDIDRIARDAGRDPSTIEKTAALFVAMPSATGERGGRSTEDFNAITGSPVEMAEQLSRFVDVGISHIQLVIDPITEESVRALGEVAELLRA
jgi:alkanesulfonate monooxygenase SsuD/methylene tetrahydromethanopterin reductase-like flavin-dependent oxidoreductase (luciferase family)